MKWSNLKTILCPSCGAQLEEKTLGYQCARECGFQIDYDEFRIQVNRLYSKDTKHYDADSVDRTDWD